MHCNLRPCQDTPCTTVIIGISHNEVKQTYQTDSSIAGDVTCQEEQGNYTMVIAYFLTAPCRKNTKKNYRIFENNKLIL